MEGEIGGAGVEVIRPGGREVLRFDTDWRFHLGEIDSPVPTDKHIAAYMANKAGWARGAARINYDDSDWRTLDLPHDWSVEGAFAPTNYLDNGFLPRGIGWYRRHFRLDEEDRGKHLTIRFDGVSSHCTVFVNGHVLHRNFNGYTPFTVDITDIARYGGDDLNVIAVRVDATPIEGWWYEGAGIYRHVHLMKTGPLHVDHYGLFVHARKRSDEAWDTAIEITVANSSDDPVACRVGAEISEPDGQVVVAERSDPLTFPPRSSHIMRYTLPITKPRLWSVDSPTLYSVRALVVAGETLLDAVATTFGYRTIRFDPDEGFFLNDLPMKLMGTCCHQDHAGVGVAVPDSIHGFRIRRLKEMGCNAYRCAHHPPAPELLNACDRLGMLVIDENRTFGSSPEHLAQLGGMVRRDRNHPSVILWSLCNEEAIQGTSVAASIARTMTAEVNRLDPSRLVMAAVSGGILNDGALADAVEIVGINYQLPVNDAFHANRPRVPVLAAETHCVLSTRDTDKTDNTRHIFASDDSETSPWGAKARDTWRFVRDRPHIAGLFAWSGFDYRGEPTPHGWPCVSSQFGMMDTCGFPKDAFYLHKAFFTQHGQPFIHLSPHWTWPGREGQTIRVIAYTNCDEAELFVNEQSLGRRPVDTIDMAAWEVLYKQGTLRAIAFRDSQLVATTTIETTREPTALGLEFHPSADVTSIPADGHFAIPITVFALDTKHRRVPTASNLVTFTIGGLASIAGVGNGNPTSHEPDGSNRRSLFNGLAQLILQTSVAPGPVILRAESEGLTPATLHLETQPARLATVPPQHPRYFITDWRMSPITSTRPNVHETILDQDMNSWERVEPGHLQPAWQRSSGYAIYRSTFTTPKLAQSRGGAIVFHGIDGEAQIYVGDQLKTANPILIPASASPVTVSVLIRATGGQAGLVGRVEILPTAKD